MARSKPVPPYRVLPADSIRPLRPWAVRVDGRAVAELDDGAAFPDWDANLAFAVERTYRLESGWQDAVGIEAMSCDLLLTIESAGGLIRMPGARVRIPAGGSLEVTLTASPASDKLAKDLQLITGLYVARPGRRRDDLSPSLSGSRVWESRVAIRLEGGAARLPIYQVPFAKAFPGDRIDNADFHVEIDDDLGLEVEAGLAVYLNADKQSMVAEISKGNSDAEFRLWAGVLRRTLKKVLLSDADISGDSPNTVGSTVSRWVSQIWPGEPIDRLRAFARAEPSKFESQIESWLGNVVTPGSR